MYINNNFSLENLHKYQNIWYTISILYIWILFRFDITVKNKFILNCVKSIWNLSFSIFSLIGTFFFIKYSFHLISNYGFMSLINHHNKNYDYRKVEIINFFANLFCFSKVLELFDTILLKMSGKEPNFLQWYHHVVTMLYSYRCLTQPKYSSIMLPMITMNYIIHTIMYFYFFMTQFLSFNHFIKKFSWIITFFQCLQMIIAIIVYLISYFYLSHELDYFGIIMYFIYLLEFYKIYKEKKLKSKKM